jgi:hypothetical protein
LEFVAFEERGWMLVGVRRYDDIQEDGFPINNVGNDGLLD